MLLSSGSRGLVVGGGAPLGRELEREFGTAVEVVPVLVSVLVTALLRIR